MFSDSSFSADSPVSGLANKLSAMTTQAHTPKRRLNFAGLFGSPTKGDRGDESSQDEDSPTRQHIREPHPAGAPAIKSLLLAPFVPTTRDDSSSDTSVWDSPDVFPTRVYTSSPSNSSMGSFSEFLDPNSMDIQTPRSRHRSKLCRTPSGSGKSSLRGSLRFSPAASRHSPSDSPCKPSSLKRGAMHSPLRKPSSANPGAKSSPRSRLFATQDSPLTHSTLKRQLSLTTSPSKRRFSLTTSPSKRFSPSRSPSKLQFSFTNSPSKRQSVSLTSSPHLSTKRPRFSSPKSESSLRSIALMKRPYSSPILHAGAKRRLVKPDSPLRSNPTTTGTSVHWRRHHSDSEAMIKTALRRSEEDVDLIADFTKPYCLPLITGKHTDLRSIHPATMADVLKGKYSDTLDNCIIVDSRYPYEFDGGHIHGAINLFAKTQILEHFFGSKSDSNNKRTVIVFHCEFSSERGPKMLRFLRQHDRTLNKDSYPKLNFPEMYILEGGYKAFYDHTQGQLCEPQEYKPMLHEAHSDDLKMFRRKSKSLNSDKRRRQAPPLRSLSFC